jgi:transcriptional regulator with XRE-family HTH domain
VGNNLITQKELAEILNVTPPYISKLIKKGVFDNCKSARKLIKDCALQTYFLFREGKSKNIEFEPVVTEKNLDELNRLLEQTETPAQYVQVMKDFWAAKINEFKYEVEQGKYYPKEEIDKKAEKIIIAAKNKALALPTKLAPQLIAIDDVNEIQDTLGKAIYDFLEELSRLDNELV